MPVPSILHGLKIFLTKQDIIDSAILKRKKTETLDSIKRRISATSFENKPYFNFIYLNIPGHSPSRLKDPSRAVINQKLGHFRSKYSSSVEAANQKLVEFLKFIIDNDPESIIIMIGDHGSWGFRTKEDTEGNPIPHRLFILDRFGVFAGIRAPNQLSDLMENGTIKSHVNLFKYVFAYLSEDKTILETKAPDDGYNGPFLLAIKNSKILDHQIKITPP